MLTSAPLTLMVASLFFSPSLGFLCFLSLSVMVSAAVHCFSSARRLSITRPFSLSCYSDVLKLFFCLWCLSSLFLLYLIHISSLFLSLSVSPAWFYHLIFTSHITIVTPQAIRLTVQTASVILWIGLCEGLLRRRHHAVFLCFISLGTCCISTPAAAAAAQPYTGSWRNMIMMLFSHFIWGVIKGWPQRLIYEDSALNSQFFYGSDGRSGPVYESCSIDLTEEQKNWCCVCVKLHFALLKTILLKKRQCTIDFTFTQQRLCCCCFFSKIEEREKQKQNWRICLDI